MDSGSLADAVAVVTGMPQPFAALVERDVGSAPADDQFILKSTFPYGLCLITILQDGLTQWV